MRKLLILFLVLVMAGDCWAALPATMTWEIETDTGASQNNGGGYDSAIANAGTDYSIVAAPQLSITDLNSSATDNTHVCSAAHPFTATCIGNTLHITAGTSYTQGWYEVINVDTSNNPAVAYLDRSCGGTSLTNGTAALGGAFKWGGSLDDDFFSAQVAGNTTYIKIGSYAQGEHILGSVNGTAVAPIKIIGYQSSRTDNPTGTNRPAILGAYVLRFGNYYIIKNLISNLATTGESLKFGGGSYVVNCKASNSSTGYGFSVGTGYSSIINCEAVSTGGSAVFCGGSGVMIDNCHIHDSTTGITASSYFAICSSIIKSCTTGINLAANYSLLLMNNDIYLCTTGISGTTAYAITGRNNIISKCTNGLLWTTVTPGNYWNYNCYYDNTWDVNGVTKGASDITSNPLYTDPNNGDFTLQATSPCRGTGAQIGVSTGVVGNYWMNIGADQNDHDDLPDVNNVLTTDTVGGSAGLYHAPDACEVIVGAFYGSGVTYTVTSNTGITPDANGDYFYGGEYNSHHYYRRIDGLWFMWWNTSDAMYVISSALGSTNTPEWDGVLMSLPIIFDPYFGATGNALVSLGVLTGNEGTFYVPTEPNVKDGSFYGFYNGSWQFEGSYEGGGNLAQWRVK